MTSWRRRARPLLGTLVEIGVRDGSMGGADAAIDAAFAVLDRLQATLSAFDAGSDIGRFNRLPVGAALEVQPATCEVLSAASSLQAATDGAFDVSTGTGRDGWQLEGERLVKRGLGVRLDLGGIAKGYAVDRAVEALRAQGIDGGWVNAGGDLRAFGDAELPILLRDEEGSGEGHGKGSGRGGGGQPFAMLADGAFATSRYATGSRCQLAGGRRPAHVSVAAPLCLWADALTKVVALGLPQAPALLARHEARAWAHPARGLDRFRPRSQRLMDFETVEPGGGRWSPGVLPWVSPA